MVKQTQTFEGLVMSRQNYRESDMLVKILTDQFGKKMFLVNRARKPGPLRMRIILVRSAILDCPTCPL